MSTCTNSVRPFAVRPGLVTLALLAAALRVNAKLNVGAVVLVNSQAPDYLDFQNSLEPYLIQSGVPYEVRDIAHQRLDEQLRSYSLIVIGHQGLDVPRHFLTSADERHLSEAVKGGTGLVSFDGLVAGWKGGRAQPLYDFTQEALRLRFGAPEKAATIKVGAASAAGAETPGKHYITAMGPARTVTLKREITVPGVIPDSSTMVLARAGTQPLLLAGTCGRGRTVLWTSYAWTKPDVKGKVYGLDDLIWRSLVWAARKPFVLRGMPPFLALRIDDVAGFGVGSNRHLGYVSVANRHGLKPWLGIFLDDLREDPEALQALARFTQQELATASLHARRWNSFFYLDEPLLTDSAGRNIAGRAWPNQKMAANLAEAESFFARHGIVKSKLVIPHFYQFAPNNFEGLARWGAEFVCTILEPGRGYGTPMLRAAPYLSGEPPRASNAPDPVFIADWLAVPGQPRFDRQFFNFVLEVRDVTGYEWAPSGVPVEEAIRRGAEQCRRGFQSLLPAVLFTHESDHIQHLQPDEWDRILRGVLEELQPFPPIPVTLDFLAQYLRALRTSRIRSATYDEATREGAVEFEGASDVATKFRVFESNTDELEGREWQAPPFRDKIVVRWSTRPAR